MIHKHAPNEAFFSLWQRIFMTEALKVPFLAPQWHRCWLSVFKPINLFFLTYNELIIFPFLRTQDSITFSGGKEVADYLDIIGPESLKIEAWSEAIKFLKQNNVKKIILHNVPESSRTFSFFKNLQSEGNIEILKEDTTPILKLPKNWSDYLAQLSRKHRHELRRKIRKFETLNSNLKLVISSHISKDIDVLLKLMSLNKAKRIFLNEEMKLFFTKIIEYLPESTQLLTLKSNDVVIAATLSFIMNNNVHLYNSGFMGDQFSGAGFYAKTLSIKNAIEMKYDNYNFLQGSERYKYELGGKDFFVYNIEIEI